MFAPSEDEWSSARGLGLAGKSGASAQLAALLTTFALERVAHPALTAIGDIWATGGVRAQEATWRIEKVTEDIFLEKLRLFAKAPPSNKVFMCPTDNWQLLDKSERELFERATPTIRACSLKEFARLTQDFEPQWSGRLVVLVGEAELTTLLHAVFTEELPGPESGRPASTKARPSDPIARASVARRAFSYLGARSRRLITFAVLIFVVVGVFAVAESGRVPVAHRYLGSASLATPARLGPRHFESAEFGVLVEDTAFSPSVNTRDAIRNLTKKAAAWRENVIEHLAQYSPGCVSFIPQIRVMAVPQVDAAAVAAQGAALGFSGSLTLSGEEYHLRDAEVFLNLQAFSPSSPGRGKIEVDVRTGWSRGGRAALVDYWPRTVKFGLPVINAIFDKWDAPRAPAPGRAFELRYPLNREVGEIEVGECGLLTAQNLNYAEDSELASASDAERLGAPVKAISTGKISFSDLRDYVTSGLLLRIAAEQASKDSATADDGSPILPYVPGPFLFPGNPPLDGTGAAVVIDSLRFEFYAEVNLTTSLVLLVMDPEQMLAPLRQRRREFGTATWLQPLMTQYDRAARSDRDAPAAARIARDTVRLLCVTGNVEAILEYLTRAAISAVGIQRARILLLLMKYRLLFDVDRKDQWVPDPATLQELRLLLDSIRASGHRGQADFEEARLEYSFADMAFGGYHASGTRSIRINASPRDLSVAQRLLTEALRARPRHLLSRFMLSKLVARSDPSRRIRLLNLMIDDIKDTAGRYDDRFHSLGEIDDVHYSIDPTYVVSDLLTASIACADEATALTAVAKSRDIPGVNWADVRQAAKCGATSFYLFPGRFVETIAATCGEPDQARVDAARVRVLSELDALQ